MTNNLYLYYIEEEHCRIPWHFVFDSGAGALQSWTALAIRSTTEKLIYGVASGTAATFMTIDISTPDKPIVMRNFTSPYFTYEIIAPRHATHVFTWGANQISMIEPDAGYRSGRRITTYINTQAVNDFVYVGQNAIHVLKLNTSTRSVDIIKLG